MIMKIKVKREVKQVQEEEDKKKGKEKREGQKGDDAGCREERLEENKNENFDNHC